MRAASEYPMVAPAYSGNAVGAGQGGQPRPGAAQAGRGGGDPQASQASQASQDQNLPLARMNL